MTANAATDDQRSRPTAEQVETYARRESELRQRYLKGVLDFDVVIDGLQKLMEMTRGCINCNGQPEIPSWANQKNPIIQHLLCGMIDPSKLTTQSVFEEGESVLDGEEYLTRAQKLDSMNACAFDFYARPENWKYLPNDADVIVFPKTVFRDSVGGRCVGCLYRGGAWWDRGYGWLDGRFLRHYQVACSQVNSLVSDPGC